MKTKHLTRTRCEAEKKMAKAYRTVSLIALVFLFISVTNASALTIVPHFMGGTAPANAAGGGDLAAIMSTAAQIWESAYSDPFVLDLYYGWGPSGDAGTHTMQLSDAAGREVAGVIVFDNSGSVSFFLDPTPGTNEEYKRQTDEYQDLGNGSINVAKVLGSPTGDAAGHVDLLSVALHEIGHALGLSTSNSSFLKQSSGGFLSISDEYPFAGTEIPLARNNSGVIAHFDANTLVYGSVMSGVNGDERRLPSELDILANAQVSSFTLASNSTTSSIDKSRNHSIGNRGGSTNRVALGQVGSQR
jgi:hypothetical protein